MPNTYSPAYRARLVARLRGPNAITACKLAKETGVAQNTLSRWLNRAKAMDSTTDPDKFKPRKEWTLSEKVRILGEAEALSEKELGAFLRREGVHPDELQAWRTVLESGRVDRRAQTQIRNLKRELRRKEKALAEAAALLILKKKAQLLGLLPEDEDDDTDGRNES